MENDITLSICIPIYNFGKFIASTLDSIVIQATEIVEIIILDGGSTDDTSVVLEEYLNEYKFIHYYKFEERGGIDKDFEKCVSLARGEYCWLFSGDDIMLSDSIQSLLLELKSREDLYLCESIICDFNLLPLNKHNMLSLKKDTSFDLSDNGTLIEYLKLANNTAAIFSFCSSLVVKKSKWDSVNIDPLFYGTCWAHVARFFTIKPYGLRVRYLRNNFLLKRGDNDSFMEYGVVGRHALAIDGYNLIASYFFKESSRESYLIRSALRKELTLIHMLNLRLFAKDNGTSFHSAEVARLINSLYLEDSFKIKCIKYFAHIFPLSIYRFIKRFSPKNFKFYSYKN